MSTTSSPSCPVWRVDPQWNAEQLNEALRPAAELLAGNQVVGFPTETVYGLGGNAFSDEAITKIFAAKGRPSDNPLIVHVSDLEMFRRLVDNVPSTAEALIKAFWPGPLTVVVKPNPGISKKCTAGIETVGIRMPSDVVARALIRLANVPIAAPSANVSGRPSPTKATHVIEDLGSRIAGVVDGGATGVGVESTVVDCTIGSDQVMILRPGGITLEMLQSVIPVVTLDPALSKLNHTSPSAQLAASCDDADSKIPTVVPRAPGMKYAHYAPRAPVYLVEGSESFFESLIRAELARGHRVGVLATCEKTARLVSAVNSRDCVPSACGQEHDGLSVARELYSALRHFDELERTSAMPVDIILAETFPRNNIGLAVMNRLEKAAASKVLKETLQIQT